MNGFQETPHRTLGKITYSNTSDNTALFRPVETRGAQHVPTQSFEHLVINNYLCPSKILVHTKFMPAKSLKLSYSPAIMFS